MVTYDRIIFDMEKKRVKYMVLKHNQGFDSAQKLLGEVLTPALFFTERVKSSVKLFSGLIIIETNVFVAHGRHISQFYLKNQSFQLRQEKHFTFKSYIKFMFKRMHIHPVTQEKFFSVGLLLENGEIHVIDSHNPSDYQSWKLNDKMKN